jgi:hypothetical protein
VLQVRAQVLTVVTTHEYTYPEDADIDGKRVPQLNLLPDISLNSARLKAQAYVEHHRLPRPIYVATTSVSIYESAMDSMLAIEISDRGTVRDYQTGTEGPFLTEQITHSIVGLELISRFGLEKAVATPGPSSPDTEPPVVSMVVE